MEMIWEGRWLAMKPLDFILSNLMCLIAANLKLLLTNYKHLVYS
jgi:hypothetical protein